MSIVLQLDVPALERLIGGDSQVEVELRKGVVEGFAKHKLTAVLKDKNFQEFLAKEARMIQDELDKLVRAHIGTESKADTWGRRTTILRPEVQTFLEAQADRVLQERVQVIVEERWKTFEPILQRKVDQALSSLTNQYIDKQIKDRLTQITAQMAEIATSSTNKVK